MIGRLLQPHRVISEVRRSLAHRRSSHEIGQLYKKYQQFTMVPWPSFEDNISLAMSARNVPGCVVECGVWRGGMIAAMAEVLGGERTYSLFDSFEGLPEVKAIDGPAAQRWQSDTQSPGYFDNCSAEVTFCETAMAMSPAKRVNIHRGWFSDTLPGFDPGEDIAVLRLDADWYESTMQCLESLYHRVAPNGLIIIDDYYTWDGCARAVHEYLARHSWPDRIQQTRHHVCYLRRADVDTAAAPGTIEAASLSA